MKKYKIHTLNDGEIEFKLIPAEEADRYYQSLLVEDDPYLEEFIFNSITGSKYVDTELSAGVIPTVVFASLSASGVIKSKLDFIELVEKSRKYVNQNAFYSLYKKIVVALPNEKLADLKEKTLNEIMELLAFAEIVYGKEMTDTKKARVEIEKEEAEANSVSPAPKKGIKGITKQDIEMIKNLVNFDTMEML